jgi:hypothetical protein
MSTPRKAWHRADSLILTALLAFAALWTGTHIHWSWTPMEDAAMLLRYAENLAGGHGIRWSLNQAPVDGATDFLFMVLIAGVSRVAHFDVITTSRVLNIAAQFLSVALLYRGARRLNANAWIAAAAVLYLIAGPFCGLANSCFGAPVFAFFLLACWQFGLRYALESSSWRNAMAMAFFGLLAGLTRPEGVLVAILLLIATLYLCSPTLEATGVPPQRLPLLMSYLLFFGLLGGAYFVWRWHYFGYPLPNPFYIKGNGHLYPLSVRKSATNVVVLLLPWLPLIPLGWLGASTRHLTNALLIVLVPFTLMWVLLSNANNHLARFQYAIVPLALMTIPALLPSDAFEAALKPLSLSINALRAATILSICAATIYVARLPGYTETAWGMRVFAQRLAPLADRGYTMAVTEAGALPLYSRWNAVDIFGLNDAYIAHHHQQIDATYLDRVHPEIIMTHIDRSFPEEFVPGGLAHVPQPGLAYSAEFANYYAVTHGYALAAAWGPDQCTLHLYWLRPGFPDYVTVLSDIRDHPYNYLDNGFLSHDYRNEMSTTEACAAPEGPPQ